ncbi:ras-related protein Rab-44 isoform X4 [Poecilia formosa]|nr:PREDICTED: ras-related protein Rab-44-like isoform X4 [Poecilia formosa]
MDASYLGGISATVNPLESQGEKPQETSKQKKRKIGSSRRTPLNRKRDGERHERDEAEESDFSAKAEMTNLGEIEVVGKVLVNEEVRQSKDVQPQQEASLQQETPETETGDGLQSSNMSLAFPPEQSATIDLILGTPKPDDFTNSQTQICPKDTERNSSSLNQPVSSNTGTPGESLECTQGDELSPESIEVSQVQDVQVQMPSSTNESIQSQNPGMRTGSPDLTPTNRRRKMGSTRKNLGTRSKQEIVEPEKESTDTVLSSGDVTVASVSGKKETELQLHAEHTDDNTYQEKQKETVEISQFGESLLRALVEEEKAEESSISQTQAAETKRQWDPSGLSSSPSSDGTSESAFGGRRKKFGSNRKSGLQRKPDQNAQNEDEAGGLIEGSALKAAGREESSGLRKISEVDENGQKPSSSTDISGAAGSSKSMRDKTPEKLVHRNIRLDQESGSQLSFGATSGADKSDSYNVVMIGESCVGKTSFMRRAQSGKFSLDIPASVGLDSCKWTVVVDGKPVVLQLWDTAGQERFHSITRQVFHKAQAFLLMYDITSSQSFSAVSYWANSIQEAAAEDVTVLLLGNKSEHAKRQVKTEQGDILAKVPLLKSLSAKVEFQPVTLLGLFKNEFFFFSQQEYNFEFMECSAATGENVIEALEAVARMLSQRADLLREEVTVLHKEPAQRKSSKCC